MQTISKRRFGSRPSTVLTGLFAMAVVALASVSAAAQEFKDGPNLIKNPSLEVIEGENPQDWQTRVWSGDAKFEIETTFGHSGDRCVKISSTNGADASWSFPVKVKPHTEYRLTAWIKTDSIDAGGFGAQLNLHELQMEGKTEPLRGTNDWTKVTSQFNSGGHRQLLVNLLYGGWGRATGVAWFDDVKLVELIPAVPEMSEADALALFENTVLPILKERCFECHGGEEVRAEYVLTNREDLILGGESGEAIDLESPLDSMFLEAINYESYEMPPDGKLSDEEIEAITKWVQLGVPWKGEGIKPEHMAEESSSPKVTEETKKWWSYQPVTRPRIPRNSAIWAANPIDEFIFRKLDEADLEPNRPASKQVLIRRAYYDLIGLPPTPEQVRAFVEDDSPDAYEKLIDELLASPHYGEKWARHWLDIVRYAESNSYERDGTKPYVWRYRDYVIRAFNNDKPFDQFTIEQLAGDELETETADSIIATGYYRLGRWDDEPVDHEQAWYDDMDDILSTTGEAFLGMTINCARCHDHKIDPVPQADYYRMLAFFRNVRRYGVRAHETVVDASTRIIASPEIQAQHRQQVQEHTKAVETNRLAMKEIEEIVKKDFIPVEHEEFKHEMNRVPLVEKRAPDVITADQAAEYKKLFEEMRRLRNEKPAALESALCVKERGDTAPETFITIRGNAKAQGDLVEPGFPLVLSPPEPDIVKPSDGESTGRRLALARWIVNPENPLTARVLVNRIWQHHFGRGIVRTASDFGFQGTEPTHPELLDWLASELVDGGWRLKRIHKLIMMSNAYQMSSSFDQAAFDRDPLNDLFWRYDMRRLTAEEIRDSILAVNESLNLEKMYGPSIYPVIPKEVLHGQSRPGENWGKSSVEDVNRRSIYIHIKRSLPVPLMAAFDVADPDTSCPVRFNTVQPTQALAMVNSDFLNEQAKVFADRLREKLPGDLNGQVKLALNKTMQREPTDAEVQRGVRFISSAVDAGVPEAAAMARYCLIALNLNEFLFLD